YGEYLSMLAAAPAAREEQEFDRMSRGWAIGTEEWRRTLTRNHAALALTPGLEVAESRAINVTRWRDAFESALLKARKSAHDIAADAKGARWKIELAAQLRQTVNA